MRFGMANHVLKSLCVVTDLSLFNALLFEQSNVTKKHVYWQIMMKKDARMNETVNRVKWILYKFRFAFKS